MQEAKAETTLAQAMADVPDEYLVFQACVDNCLTIAETETVMAEWNAIRARVTKTPTSQRRA
jgi:hypothetical protein